MDITSTSHSSTSPISSFFFGSAPFCPAACPWVIASRVNWQSHVHQHLNTINIMIFTGGCAMPPKIRKKPSENPSLADLCHQIFYDRHGKEMAPATVGLPSPVMLSLQPRNSWNWEQTSQGWFLGLSQTTQDILFLAIQKWEWWSI